MQTSTPPWRAALTRWARSSALPSRMAARHAGRRRGSRSRRSCMASVFDRSTRTSNDVFATIVSSRPGTTSATVAEGAAGQDAGVRALVDDDLAVDDHVRNPERKLLGLSWCRRGLHRGRVEHDDVRLQTIAQEPAIAQAEPLRGKRRHLSNGLGQLQLLF